MCNQRPAVNMWLAEVLSKAREFFGHMQPKLPRQNEGKFLVIW